MAQTTVGTSEHCATYTRELAAHFVIGMLSTSSADIRKEKASTALVVALRLSRSQHSDGRGVVSRAMLDLSVCGFDAVKGARLRLFGSRCPSRVDHQNRQA